MELTMIIDDPKFYTKPWVALDKLQLKLMPPNTDLVEMMCSPTEIAEYNRKHASKGAPKK